MELDAEQHDVRQSVKRNLYTGRTHNSLDNIAQFFAERGMPVPTGIARAQQSTTRAASPAPPQAVSPPPKPIAARTAPKPRGAGVRTGIAVTHPKYGRGIVLRREGEGEDAKLTINFPEFGLKKMIEKYAGIKVEE